VLDEVFEPAHEQPGDDPGDGGEQDHFAGTPEQ